MNLGELRTSTLVWLNDLNGGYYTTSQVNRWLNNAMWSVYRRLVLKGQNYGVKCVQTPLVVSQSEYVLPEDFKNLTRLEVITSGTPPTESKYALKPMTMNQQDLVFTTQTSSPQWYFLRKNRIKLFPAPASAYSMRLFYTPIIAEMDNDTDIPDVIPEDYHELIVLYATRDGFVKDERPIPDLLMAKISEFEEQFDNDTAERLEDQSRQVVETGDYSDAGFMY
jgi:hypothetical protein